MEVNMGKIEGKQEIVLDEVPTIVTDTMENKSDRSPYGSNNQTCATRTAQETGRKRRIAAVEAPSSNTPHGVPARFNTMTAPIAAPPVSANASNSASPESSAVLPTAGGPSMPVVACVGLPQTTTSSSSHQAPSHPSVKRNASLQLPPNHASSEPITASSQPPQQQLPYAKIMAFGAGDLHWIEPTPLQEIKDKAKRAAAFMPPAHQANIINPANTNSNRSMFIQSTTASAAAAQDRKDRKKLLLTFNRILMKDLNDRNPPMHAQARSVIRECTDQNRQGNPAFALLSVSMQARLRKLVGELDWKKTEDCLAQFLKKGYEKKGQMNPHDADMKAKEMAEIAASPLLQYNAAVSQEREKKLARYNSKVAIINDKATGKSGTFEELEKGYSFESQWKQDAYGDYQQFCEAQTTYVDMSKPISCSYNKINEETDKLDPIALNRISLGQTSSPSPVEHRAITLRQLRAVFANIERRCGAEGWVNYKNEKLSPDTVTLYDANAYVIYPYTKDKALSFVACLPSTAGPQLPRFCAIHWWGEPVKDFLKCIEQFVRDFGYNWWGECDERGGGMTEDTPIWVCAYANNQHDLSSDITADPKQSGFTRAMEAAEGRTITILDTGGVVFSRIWCAFELYLTLVNKRAGECGEKLKQGVWAVYTAHNHTGFWKNKREAVGIISGGAPVDGGEAYETAEREQEFPFGLIKKALMVKVETAEASEEADRIHILNSIIGKDGDGLNDMPPWSYVKYGEVNEAVRVGFISTIANVGSLRKAAEEDDDIWNAFLLALSKGKRQLNLSFEFNDFEWDGLADKPERAAQMIRHFPLTIVKLDIKYDNFQKLDIQSDDFITADFGTAFVDVISEHIHKSSQLNELHLETVNVLGDDEGFDGDEEREMSALRFAEAVGESKSLTTLSLDEGMIGLEILEQWGFALTKNKTLTNLVLHRVNDKKEMISKLKDITKDRTPKLEFK